MVNNHGSQDPKYACSPSKWPFPWFVKWGNPTNYWIKSWEPILQVSIFNKTRSRYASISAQSFGTRRLAYFFWVLCCDGFYRRRQLVFGSQVLVFFGLQIFEISDFSGNLWRKYIVYLGDKCICFSDEVVHKTNQLVIHSLKANDWTLENDKFWTRNFLSTHGNFWFLPLELSCFFLWKTKIAWRIIPGRTDTWLITMFLWGSPSKWPMYGFFFMGGPIPTTWIKSWGLNLLSDFTQLGRETSSKDDQGTHLWEVFHSDCHGFVLDQDLIGLRSLPPQKTNMTVENPAWMKMYFLLKNGHFPMLVFSGVADPMEQKGCFFCFRSACPEVQLINFKNESGF